LGTDLGVRFLVDEDIDRCIYEFELVHAHCAGSGPKVDRAMVADVKWVDIHGVFPKFQIHHRDAESAEQLSEKSGP